MLDGMVFDGVGTAGGPGSDPAADLLVRLSAGDVAAGAELYDLLGDRVYGLLLRVTDDPDRSADLLLDVFTQVADTAGAAPRGISPSAWVLAVAHDVAVADAQAMRAAGEATPAAEESADEVDLRVESRRVARTLQSLPEVQRDALAFAYYGGYTRAEIATLTERPEATVHEALRDGLTRLRIESGMSA